MTSAITGARPIVVVKIGGSILTGVESYREAARFVAGRRRREPDAQLVVVVSAQHGQTDELEATARVLVADPAAAPLDLLWSTGELRSVALLALALQAEGINAAGANVHQTGLRRDAGGRLGFSAAALRALLASHDVVIVPGFLACSAADGIVSLGRGGSDFTAVRLAAGLDARRCELIKDVDGYYAADPKANPHADQLLHLDFERSLEMADAGCALVQREAIETARAHALPLVVRSMASGGGTLLSHVRPQIR